MHRRQVLLGTGVALPTIIAGCIGDDGGPADETGSDADETDAGDEADGDDEEVDEADDEEDEGEADDAGGDDDETADDDGEEDDPFAEDREPPVQGLRISEHEFVEDEYSVSVVGTVANESGEDLISIEVAVAFYDADGNRVDENTARIGELDDDEEVTVEVVSREDDVATYEIAITEGALAERTPG